MNSASNDVVTVEVNVTFQINVSSRDGAAAPASADVEKIARKAADRFAEIARGRISAFNEISLVRHGCEGIIVSVDGEADDAVVFLERGAA